MTEKQIEKLKDEFMTNENLELGANELTTLLFYAAGISNPADKAQQMLGQCSSLYDLLARGTYLCDDDTSLDFLLKLVNRIFNFVSKQKASLKLQTFSDIIDFCERILSRSEVEEMYMVCLSRNNSVVNTQRFCDQNLDGISLNLSQMLRTVISCKADKVFLAHSHPNGVAKPSLEDIKFTHRFNILLHSMEVTLLEHLIVSPVDSYSFYKSGSLAAQRNSFVGSLVKESSKGAD